MGQYKPPDDDLDLDDIPDDDELDLSDIEDVKLDDIPDAEPIAASPSFADVVSASSSTASPTAQFPIQEEPNFFESMEGKSPIQALSDPTTLAFQRRGEQDTREIFAPARADTSNVARATAIGALEGMNEGAGEVLTSMSAPVDALAQLTGIKGLSQAARYARMAGQAGSAGTAIRGGSNLFGADKTLAERASGLGEMVLGSLGTGAVPHVKVPTGGKAGKVVTKTLTNPETGNKTTLTGDETEIAKAVAKTEEANAAQIKKAREVIIKNMGPAKAEQIFKLKNENELSDLAKHLVPIEKSVSPVTETSLAKKPVMSTTRFPEGRVKDRYYELMDREQAGKLMGAELEEAQWLDKKLRNADIRPIDPNDLSGAPNTFEGEFTVDKPKQLTESIQTRPLPGRIAQIQKQDGITLERAREKAYAEVNKGSVKTEETRHFAQPKPIVESISGGMEPKNVANEAKPRIKVKMNADGTFTNKETGETVNNLDAPIKVDDVDKIGPDEIKLPPELETNITDKASIKPKEEHAITKGLNVFRALQTSVDLSFPFRQGLGQILTKGWWKAWKGMVNSYGSEAAYQGVVKSVQDDPDFQFYMDNGLALPDMNTRMEEMHRSNIAEKIPIMGRGVKASGRAYNAFAIKSRTDNARALIKNAEKIYETAIKTGSARPGLWKQKFDKDSAEMLNPRTNLTLAKEIMEMVNVTSGRGNLGSLEKIIGGLNTTLYSPRFLKSRLDMLNPMRYKLLNSQAQLEYGKSALALSSFWLTTAAMLKQVPGVTVVDDPDSADFGKIQFGDTRFDPPAGLQQYIVLLHRIGSGEKTSTTGARETREMGSGWQGYPGAIADFGLNKLAPGPSILKKFMFRSSKRPFELGEELLGLITPMTVGTLSNIIQDEPWMFPSIIPAALGISSQTYDDEGNKPRLLGPLFPAEKDISLTGKGWFQ